jgi:hypothetical protein
MLRYVLFDTTYFASGDDVVETRKNVLWLLEALVQRNMEYLRQRPSTPKLYKSGVVYQVPKQMDGECEEVQILKKALGKVGANQRDVARVLDLVQDVLGGERFRDIGRIIENGGGDCDNLAAWRVAELRQKGIQARPYMTHRERIGGGTTYHALVLWPPFGSVKHETSEDPSLLLGMGGPARAADRAEEIRKNVERCEILQKQGIGPGLGMPLNSMEAELESVLGIRRSSHAGEAEALAEIEKLLRVA